MKLPLAVGCGGRCVVGHRHHRAVAHTVGVRVVGDESVTMHLQQQLLSEESQTLRLLGEQRGERVGCAVRAWLQRVGDHVANVLLGERSTPHRLEAIERRAHFLRRHQQRMSLFHLLFSVRHDGQRIATVGVLHSLKQAL